MHLVPELAPTASCRY